MIILIHVVIALASVGFASFTFFKPTIKRLYTSYGLIVATVASGTLLLLSSPSDILRSCLAGLLYVTVISVVTIASHARMHALADTKSE